MKTICDVYQFSAEYVCIPVFERKRWFLRYFLITCRYFFFLSDGAMIQTQRGTAVPVRKAFYFGRSLYHAIHFD